jgi:ribulose-phosphate 3-epimerase
MGPAIIGALRKSTNLPFDVHLMIKNPDMYVESFADAGADFITVHTEAATTFIVPWNSSKKRGKRRVFL